MPLPHLHILFGIERRQMISRFIINLQTVHDGPNDLYTYILKKRDNHNKQDKSYSPYHITRPLIICIFSFHKANSLKTNTSHYYPCYNRE